MAYTDGNIVIGTSVDVGGINTGLNKITKQFGKLSKMLAGLTLGEGVLTTLGKSAIEAASDLQEVQNIVDVAFGDMSYKIEAFASTSIDKFGMSEFAAKSTAGSFMAMGKAMNLSSEDASNMAIQLTALTGDMASFFNISQDYAKVALSAVYTGETETLKRYGIVLTEANLQAYALSQGIQTNVKTMNAHDKAVLRFNYIMQTVGKDGMNMVGDFNRTSENWANQLRVVKERFNLLSIAIGNGLIVALNPLLGVLNNIIVALIKFVKLMWIILGNIFGIDFGAVAKGFEGTAEGMEDSADAAEDLAAGVTKAGKAAKKYTSHLDELNILMEPSGSGGGGASPGLDLDIDLGTMLDLQQAIEDLRSDIDNLYDFGVWVGEKLTSVLEGIDWESVYQGAKDFGKGLAEFLNGLISTDLFKDVAHTIAGALNTAIYTALAFGKEFDFTQFGEKLADAVNEFFDTFDFKAFGETIGTWWNGFKDAMKAFLDKVDWSDIFQGIKDFFSGIDETKAWDLIGLAALATTISLAIGLLKTPIGQAVKTAFIDGFVEGLGGVSLTTLLSNFFGHGGLNIGILLSNVGSTFKFIFSMIGVTIQGFFTQTIPGLFAKIPIAGALSGLTTFFTNVFSALKVSLIKIFGTTVVEPIAEGIGESFVGIEEAAYGSYVEIESIEVATTTLSSVLSTIAGVLSIIVGSVTAIWNFVSMLIDGFSWFKEILMVVGIIVAAIGVGIVTSFTWWLWAIAAVVAIIMTAIVLVKQYWTEISTFFTNVFTKIKDMIIAVYTKIYDFGYKVGTFIGSFLKSAWEKVYPAIEWVATVAQGVWIILKALFILAKEWIVEAYEHIKLWVQSAWDFVLSVIEIAKEWISKFIESVKTFITNAWEHIKQVVTTIKEFISKIINFFQDLFEAFYFYFVNRVLIPIRNYVMNIVEKIKDFIDEKLKIVTDLIDALKNWIYKIADKIWDKVGPTVTKIYEWFKEKWDLIVDMVSTFVETYISPLVKGFIDKFEWLKENLGTIFDSIKEGALEMANGIITGVEKAINSIIDTINGWVDGFNAVVSAAALITGDSWSGVAHIGHVSIPKLANGAVLPPNNPFMAIVGDQKQGTNIEAPLSTIQDAVALVLEPYLKQLVNNTQELVSKDYTTYIGDREIAKANNRGQKQLGATIMI